MVAYAFFCLMSPHDWMRLDVMVWVLAIPVLIIAILFLIYQRREFVRLRRELGVLAKIQRHPIEYDLVLKAMKLSVWRIDVPTHTLVYESDYRDSLESPVLTSDGNAEAVYNMMQPAYQEIIKAKLTALAEGKIEELHEQYELRTPKSDRVHWGEMYAVVDKRTPEGTPLTIVGTSMNIDKQKEIEQALMKALSKAEESDRLKSAFLANMSHEVRTPLNAIVGFSDVLAASEDEAERKQLVELIKENNTQLLHLFNDMVSISKLDAGGETVKKIHFNLNALLSELTDNYKNEAKKKGLRLLVSGMADAPRVYTDAGRLREILNQYLNNALKFTDHGSITLGYDISGGKLRVWVRDTGRGIPADRCNEQLFERFVKIDDFVPGTGLGLSICRSLAHTLDGSVGVESREGEGSLFWVEIDMER